MLKTLRPPGPAAPGQAASEAPGRFGLGLGHLEEVDF